MNGLNKVMLIGHLGKDPELKESNGKVFCKFSLATTETYNGKAHTEWHNVTVFGKVASACGKILKKGAPVFVEGKIGTKVINDGAAKKYYTGITAFNVSFLGAKGEVYEDSSVDSAKEILGASEEDDFNF